MDEVVNGEKREPVDEAVDKEGGSLEVDPLSLENAEGEGGSLSVGEVVDKSGDDPSEGSVDEVVDGGFGVGDSSIEGGSFLEGVDALEFFYGGVPPEGAVSSEDYTDFVDEEYSFEVEGMTEGSTLEVGEIAEGSTLEESGGSDIDEVVERLGAYAPSPKKRKKRGGGSEEALVVEEVEPVEVLGENVFLDPKVPMDTVEKKNEEFLGEGVESADSLSWELVEPEEKGDIPYLVFSEGEVPVLGVALTKRAVEELSAAMRRAHGFYVPKPKRKLKWYEKFGVWYRKSLRKHGVMTVLGTGFMGVLFLFVMAMAAFGAFVNSRLGSLLFGG